jgi:hypothetical protein
MYRDFTLFGPGVFRIYDGPTSDEFIEIGPLLPNQVAFLRSDPRSHTPLVLDLTSTAPTSQELNRFQKALKKRFGARWDTNVDDQQIASRWESYPQGPFYSLLKGRFSDRSAIPPKPAAGRPRRFHPHGYRRRQRQLADHLLRNTLAPTAVVRPQDHRAQLASGSPALGSGQSHRHRHLRRGALALKPIRCASTPYFHFTVCDFMCRGPSATAGIPT